MGTAYANALKQKEKLVRELAEIDQFLALHERFSGTKVDVPEPISGIHIKTFANATVRRRVTPMQVVPMIRRILTENGQPMTRGEIVKALHERDVALKGDDEPRYVGTILWRFKGEFINIRGHGYWIRKEPCEAVDYTPPIKRPGGIKRRRLLSASVPNPDVGHDPEAVSDDEDELDEESKSLI